MGHFEHAKQKMKVALARSRQFKTDQTVQYGDITITVPANTSNDELDVWVQRLLGLPSK